MTSDPITQARAAYSRRAWGDALGHYEAAEGRQPLPAEDLERLATALFLVGREHESEEAWGRAHQAFAGRGSPEGAARCAVRLAFMLFDQGEPARGSGWLARARRLLEENGAECAEHGYLLIPEGIGRLDQGDAAGAFGIFGRAAEIGHRHGDRDLELLARHGQGRALIREGRIASGVALLDEVMAGIIAGEASPLVAGDVYCSVITACDDMFDLRRAREWTEALARWCAEQPDLVAWRGQCRLRRAEIMQQGGAWREALEEVRQACDPHAEHPDRATTGSAFYRLAELHRLRGDFEEAGEAYREASAWGREPQPGLALLRLAQGNIPAARSAVRQLAELTRDIRKRPPVLAAGVEILLAADDTEAAGEAAAELSRLASTFEAPLLRAMAAQGSGAVLLATGDAAAALPLLHQARDIWRDIGVPYESARVGALIGQACHLLGDHDTAAVELEGARRVFARLGAVPDMRRTRGIPARPDQTHAGLTGREHQVLRLLAAGMTNRAIAGELSISERTVARHVSNIFLKLEVATRAAAAAYAWQHGLA